MEQRRRATDQKDFRLDGDDVAWTVRREHWQQTIFMLTIGLLVFFVPDRRFGNSFHFIVTTPGGQHAVGGLFVVVGVVMCWGLLRNRRLMMCRGLFAAGMANFLLGVSLALGAVFGPTGVVGAPFCLYVAAHMMSQSELLGKRK